MPQPSAAPASSPAFGLLLVCLAGVVWGTIGPAVHVVDERSSLSVLSVGAYRGVAALATLALAVAVSGRLGRCVALLRAAPARAVLVGVTTAAFQLLFFVAVVWAGVSITTVVALGFAPVLLLVLGAVRRRARPGRADLLTVGVAVAGLLLVGLAGGGDPDPSRPVLGVLAALGSGTAYALSAEAVGPLSRSHDALTVGAVTMSVTGGLLVLAGLPLALLRGEPVVTTDATSWLLIAWLGVVTLALAYVLFFAGLRTTPSGAAVVATLLEPVTAVLLAVLLLGETLTAAGVAGSLLILGAIASLGRRPGTRPEALQ